MLPVSSQAKCAGQGGSHVGVTSGLDQPGTGVGYECPAKMLTTWKHKPSLVHKENVLLLSFHVMVTYGFLGGSLNPVGVRKTRCPFSLDAPFNDFLVTI